MGFWGASDEQKRAEGNLSELPLWLTADAIAAMFRLCRVSDATSATFSMPLRYVQVVRNHRVAIFAKLFARMAYVSLLKLTFVSALVYHVVGVFRRRSKKQVIRVDAERIVAGRTVMENPQAIGDWAANKLPRKTWSDMAYTIRSKRTVTGKDSPARAASPKPTAIGFIYKTPKARGNHLWSVAIQIVALIRAELQFRCEIRVSRSNVRRFAVLANGNLVLHRRDLPSLGVAGPGLLKQLAASFILPQQITRGVL